MVRRSVNTTAATYIINAFAFCRAPCWKCYMKQRYVRARRYRGAHASARLPITGCKIQRQTGEKKSHRHLHMAWRFWPIPRDLHSGVGLHQRLRREFCVRDAPAPAGSRRGFGAHGVSGLTPVRAALTNAGAIDPRHCPAKPQLALACHQSGFRRRFPSPVSVVSLNHWR